MAFFSLNPEVLRPAVRAIEIVDRAEEIRSAGLCPP